MRAGLVAGSVSRRAMPLPPPALRHPTALIVFSLLLLALAAAVPSVDAAYRVGATSCSSSECSQSTTKQYIIIVCRAGAAITGLTQRTAYGAGAQPAACPTGTVIAYGFSFYMSDGLRDTNCLYNNKVCDLGQQSCSTSSCSTRHCGGSGGDEYSFIYLLCMPSAAVTLSSGDFVSKTGTSGADSVACPDTSNYKIKFGVAMHESGFYYDQNPSNCLMLNNQAATYNSDILNHVACDTYDDSCNNDQFFLHAICVDVSAPSTPSITSPTQNQVFRTNSVSWTFTTATDAQSDIDHYECQFSSSGAWTTCISNQVSTLDVGTYSFQVRAVNGAGLTSSSSSRAFSVACSLECATCSPSNVNACQSCASGSYLSGTSCVSTCPEPNWGKPDGTCGDSCPANTYGDTHQNRACVSTCTNFAPANASPSARVCVDQCPSPYYGDSINHLCVESCPAPNYFGDASRSCVTPCPDGTYGNPLSLPRVCVSACTGGYYADSVNHLCVESCPAPNYFGDASRSCVSPCPDGTYGNPLSLPRVCVSTCTGGYYAEPTSKVCVQTCPGGTYGDGLRTPPSCSASCTSGTFKDDASHSCVTNCPANSWADSLTGRCSTSCTGGRFKDDSTRQCVENCPTNSWADSSAGTCASSCSSGLFRQNSNWTCVAECAGGLFADSSSGSCVVSCPANSWADSSTHSCASTCSVEFAYNATWSCVSPCPVGYADNSTQSCVTRCPSGTFASKASRQCVAACPKGEVPNSATNTCTAAASSDSSPAVGIAVGVACGVLVIIILVLVLLRRKRRQSKQPEPGNVTNPLYEASAPECPAADYMMHSNSSFAPLTANDQPAGKSASSMRGVRPAQLASHAYGPVSADGSVRGAADTTGSSPAAPPAPLPKPAVSTAPKPAVSKAPKPVAPPKPVVAAPEPTPAAKRVPKPVQSPHVPLSAHTIEHGVAPRALGIDVNETSEYATIKGSSAASPPAEEVYSMVKREEAAETVYVALDV
ncbi:hypothetical protein CAOG_008062 [Capsaspora owczarzaki ATCC 30864]|uniref:Fibronectin type-III domain-containing protein n=1 Tax=Capsaspora owczarzaki (strain ATCC 30864) TaxID=595528 RepID=A0A0D2WYH8_CAPO3|nr:hypothetical protein CAOG_008062 [Capsaspora owczarzaki ATCC 30864]